MNSYPALRPRPLPLHGPKAIILALLTWFVLVSPAAAAASASAAPAAGPRFEISFPGSVHAQPITGRVFVVITRKPAPEPRLQIGSWTQETPFFATDVKELQPGASAAINDATLGYPLRSLQDIPEGDYFVQALINIYSEFRRADGHVIWAHMDEWEGQQFNLSPGNLYSDVQEVHLDPRNYRINLRLMRVIPAPPAPADSPWVKRIKLQSKLLTRFWGRPIYLGATVLLPKDYDLHPEVRYPVIYEQGHFSLRPPLTFRAESSPDDGQEYAHGGYELFQQWSSADFPRMIAVTIQHPTPFFDDSYAVNSANNGPYGDAIMQELIPYVEESFRVIREPWARVLTGVSTGGWEALAMLLFHPDFFGGTWAFSPDPVDFKRFQLIDLYADNNAFTAPGFEWLQPQRPLMRTTEGQVVETMRQMSQFEAVLGSHGRSGQQLDAWNAVYGPVGPDGYPRPLWDRATGKIDRQVAFYMRDHGFDLRYYLERNWEQLGPRLAGKIHVYCGDMDNYYLNLAVYLMEDFLNAATSPEAHASFVYGRPMKGHGWTPFTQAELVREMAGYITQQAPAGADVQAWKY